jgi:hypothetical protein
MSVFLSPGVFSREIDLSLYIPNLSSTAYGVVGLASKGPINEPMYITDPVQFATTFGDPADPSEEFQPAVYSALQYLHTGRQLWFVRVAEFDPDPESVTATNSAYMAKFANVALSQSSTAPKITGTVNTLMTLTSSNNEMIFVVDGAGPGFSVTFDLNGASSVVKTIPEIVALLNANNTFKTYMVASTSLTGSLVITGKVSGQEHSINISGSAITTGIFDLATVAFGAGSADEAAYILGSNAFYPVTLTSGSVDTVTFKTGVSTATLNTVTYTFAAGAYTVAEAVQALNINGAFNTNLVASSSAGQLKVSIKAGSSFKFLALAIGSQDAGQYLFGEISGLNYVLGNDNYPYTVFPYTVVTGVNDTLVLTKNDFTDPTTDTPVTVTLPAGVIQDVDSFQTILGTNGSDVATGGLPAGFDSVKVTVDAVDYIKIFLTAEPAGFGLTFDATANGAASFGSQPFEKKNSTVAATTVTVTAATQGTWANNLSVAVTNNPTSFNLDVYEKSYLVESYRNLVLTPEKIADPLAPNSLIDNPAFVEHAINGVSARIGVANSSGNTNFPLASVLGARYNFTGGSNGAPPSGTSDPSIYIGFSNNLQTTGLQFFRNPERIDINLISVPGVSDAAVLNEAIDICQTRGDAMAILDPPLGYSPQDVVDWVNGAGESADHQAFNTSYAAIYWPWLQIYDPINKKTVFTPPSGHLANVYAFTDLVSDPWIAPAGLTRGRLTTPLKAEYNPTTGERDLLYLNNINPIATFVRDGINVFGQKTLQRKPSALDRVNVRRLLLYLEKVITTAARQILFEPDDQVTWLSFVNLVEPFMASVKSRRGLTDFEVRCDKTTNTPDALDRSEMHALIFIKPTKAAEFIQVDFILTAQTANFNELVF